jgi:hypothetical protein
MKISLVINHRQNSEERKDNLFHLLKYYDNLFQKIKEHEFEIWIIEQDTSSKIQSMLCSIKNTIPIISQLCYNNGEYNRSWSANVGAKLSNADIMIYVDNDIIIPEDTLVNSLNKLNGKDQHGFDYDILVPYENFIDLNLEQTRIWKQTGKYIFSNQSCRYGTDSNHIVKVGGCFITKLKFYFSIGGMDEDCRGYGAEDDSFYYKYSRVLEHDHRDWRPRNKINNIYHLYHERLDVGWIRNQEFYRKNCEVMNNVRTMKFEDLIKYINDNKDKIGNINKYKDEK